MQRENPLLHCVYIRGQHYVDIECIITEKNKRTMLAPCCIKFDAKKGSYRVRLLSLFMGSPTT